MSPSVHMNCPECQSDMWIPEELYLAARRSSKISFFCAYGHAMHYKERPRAEEPPPPPPPEHDGENVITFPKTGRE